MSLSAPARPNRPRRSALLSLAAVAALTAAACGEAPTGTLNTRTGYTLDGAEIPVSMCPEGDESRLADEEGTLLGAHFALRVECVLSFTEIPDGFQLDYLFGEGAPAFPPADGNEFTMVQFAPDTGHEAPYEADGETALEAVLAIGGQEWSFEGEVPPPGSAYVAVVEKDAPVSIEVTDSERTQSIDLRERTRSGLVEGLYHGSRTETATEFVTHSVDAFLASGGYEYSVEDWTYSTNFVATRTVFEPEEGWIAETDRVVLSIEFVWLFAGSGLEWAIDPETTLTVSGPDGEIEPVGSDYTSEDFEEDGELRFYQVDYDVPADALEFELVFAPKGDITWPEQGVDMPISGAETHELSVSFA